MEKSNASFEHSTILACLCFYELLRLMGWPEYEISFMVMDEVHAFTSLKTQGKQVDFYAGQLSDGLKTGGEAGLQGLVAQAKAHYAASDNSDGPLRKIWEGGEFPTRKANVVRRRCGLQGIFIPPSTFGGLR